MLQEIRDKSQGWVTWILLGLLILVFALFGINYYLSSSTGGESTVATVNGQSITASQFNFAYQQASKFSQSNQSNDDLKNTVLHGLVIQALLAESADNMGFSVSGNQVDQLIYNLPSFQVDGKFSMDRYQAVLQNLEISTDQLRTQLAQDMLVTEVQQGIVNSQFVLTSEVQALNAASSQKRDIQYVTLNNKSYSQVSSISDADVQSYYQTHIDQYYTQDQVQLQYILISLSDVSKKAQGDNAKAQAMYNALGNQLANITFENPNSLDLAAQQLGLSIQTSPVLTRQGGSGIFANKDVINAAFSNNVLKQNNNSNIINLSPTQAIVLRIKQYTPAAPMPLSQVKSSIVSILQNQYGQVNAAKLANNIAQQLASGQNISSIASANQLSVKSALGLTHDNKQLDPALINAVFAQPMPSTQNPIAGVVQVNGGFAVFVVNKAYAGAASSANNQAAQASLLHAWSVLDYDQYTQSLLNTAKIKFNNG